MKLSATDAIKIISLIGFFALMFTLVGSEQSQGIMALMVQGIVTVIAGWQPVVPPLPPKPEEPHE